MEQHIFNQLSRRLRVSPTTQSVSHLDKAWRSAYEALLKFAAREGHLQIPATLAVDGVPLSKWQANQICRHHNRTLSHEKTRLLERIPGWHWSDRDAAPILTVKEDRNLDALVDKQPQTRRIIVPSADPPRTLEPEPGARSEKVKKFRLSKGWMQGLSSLFTFVDRVGHANVPSDHVESGFQLGDWVMVQRYAFLRGELQKNRIEHLERVSGWTWDIQGSGEKKKKKEIVSSCSANSPNEETEDDLLRWKLFYPQLGEFLQQERHSRVKATAIAEFTPLFKWVEQVRERYRRGQIHPKRVRQLECLEGWSWVSTAVDDKEGHANLEARVSLRKSNGKTGGCLLGNSQRRKWVAEQKQAYKNGVLTPDKRRKLEALPGLFSEREKERLWHETFEYLWFFARKEKHAQVPQDHVIEGVPLGAWVAEQRRLYRHRELKEPRRQKLEALSLWTWKPEPVPSEQ
ncbi:MAG: helicase associated domain-containing protein [Myxococcota bacterium]|jgi:hypothetical protein|nr:helicase associated domain-containing protein [Myxococcota bacterium]